MNKIYRAYTDVPLQGTLVAEESSSDNAFAEGLWKAGIMFPEYDPYRPDQVYVIECIDDGVRHKIGLPRYRVSA